MPNKRLGIIGIIAVIIVLLLVVSLFFFNRPQPTAKEIPEPALTPTEAGAIALQEFPQGKISLVSLEEKDQQYFYAVTIINLDEKYRVEVTLPSGQIRSKVPIPAETETFLPLLAMTEHVQRTFPAATVIEIALEDEDNFIFYQSELIQDGILHKIYLHPVTGAIIKQIETTEKVTTDFSQWLSITEIGRKATELYPDAQLIELDLDSDQATSATYEADLIDATHDYDLKLDARTGELLTKEITPADADSFARKLWQTGFKAANAQPTALSIE